MSQAVVPSGVSAKKCGRLPTGIVAITVLVAVLSTETVLAVAFAM